MKSLKLLMVAAILCLPVLKSWAQDEVIEIGSIADLSKIETYPVYNETTGAQIGYTGNFVLTADLDFSGETNWLPIGSENITEGTSADTQNFLGTFDGQGHKLSNITVNAPGRSFVSALFIKLGGSAVVKNLALENVNITGGNLTGGLTGTMFSNTTTPGPTVENVSVTGKITGTGEVGGISGRSNNNIPVTVRNCYVNADISGTELITSPSSQGVAQNNPQMVNIGGIIGSAYSGTDITIENCLVLNTITATRTTATNSTNLGGLIGRVIPAAANLKLNNSVVAAELVSNWDGVTGSDNTNAFWGGSAGTVTVTKCYAVDGLTFPVQDDGTSMPLADLQTQSTYAGLDWDFDNVWQMNEGEFPTLKIQGATGIAATNVEKLWNVSGLNNGIEVTASQPIDLSVYDVTGKLLYKSQSCSQANIALNKGVYIVKGNCKGVVGVEKVMVK